MDDVRLWQIGVCFAIGIHCLAFSVAQGVDECSPRCWNPVQPNFGLRGGIYREGVANEDECKALCVNNGACFGIDWNRTSNQCWFHLTTSGNPYNVTNINHWSLAICTDDCASYCWRPVQVDRHVSGSDQQTDITDENRCKLRCSSTPNCTGIDWNSSCFLIFTQNPTESEAGVNHWDIERSLPVNCISPASPASSATSNTVSPTQDTTNHTVDGQSSTNSLEDRTAGCSVNLISGILSVLLGLCIIIIIGLAFNTIRIGQRSHVKSDIKSVELSGNDYEGLEKDATKQSSEEGLYTDLVQENPIGTGCEQTN